MIRPSKLREGIGAAFLIAAFLITAFLVAHSLTAQTPARGPDPLIEAISCLDEAKSKEADEPERALEWYRKAVRAARQALLDPAQDAERARLLQREAERSQLRVSDRLKQLDRAFASIEQLEKRGMIDSSLRRLDECHPPASQERFRSKREKLEAVREHALTLVSQANSLPNYETTRKRDLYRKALQLDVELIEAKTQLERVR